MTIFVIISGWLVAFYLGYMTCGLLTHHKIEKWRTLADGRRDAWLKAIKAKEVDNS